jgi:hypothetical protein
VGIVLLAGTVGITYVALVLIVMPRVGDLERRKAIERFGRAIFLLLELVIAVLGVPVYRWAGWSAGIVALANTFAALLVCMAGLAYLNRVGLLGDLWRNLRDRQPSGEDSNRSS